MHARASVERRSCETRETRAAAREEKKKRLSFVVPRSSRLSRAFSNARGHLRFGRFARRTKKQRLLVVYTETHRLTIPVGDLNVFFVPCSLHFDHIISYFFTELKIYHYSLFNTHMTISTLLILAVRRAHVIHEPCIWPS